MNANIVLPPSTLVGVGRALLCMNFGILLLVAHRKEGSLQAAFERFAVGFICLLFFPQGMAALAELSTLFSAWIQKLGDPDGLKTVLAQAYNSTQTNGINLPNFGEQVWRTGVWAIAKSISELFFIASGFMLEQAQAIFWKILLFLFPLFAGISPVLPKICVGAVLFAFELSLWIPILRLIEVASYPVARAAHARMDSLGIPVIATEIVSIFLYLSIPVFTHRLVSGSLQGDHGVSLNVFTLTQRVTGAIK